ncbi:MAG: histidinol-phosphate transaminase [Clostridia bacterium]|nr:histidinol-phosphate transaminase [Clostridia bacterium]
MSKFLSKKYQGLQAYVPGEQPKERKYVKLNTNESPFQPSKKAQELAKEQLQKCMLYSDPDCKELCSLLAKKLGVGTENVIVGNGSDEILNFAFMAYCGGETPAVFPDITYGFYKVFADLHGAKKTELPLREDFTVNLEDYKQAKGTVFLANPNAPTGLALSVAEVEELLAADSGRIVVIDEAYVDFGWESCVPLIQKYGNLLVSQTFSKSRSLAGARLGVGIASREIIEDLNRIKYSTNPYNVNRMTAAAGVGSLLDTEYFEACRNKIIANREWTAEQLKALGFTMTESQGNFLFVRHEKIGGQELYLKLKEKGILVRHFAQERICEYNRITVGSPKEMETLVKALKEIVCER